MFKELAQSYTQKLSSFCPAASISNRTSWEALRPELRDAVITQGLHYLHFNYPALPVSLYHEFTQNGNRVHFENAYFLRRTALNALVLAECVENKGRFLEDIINGIWALCEETAWQLPAHNSRIRDTPNLPYPDAAYPILDLFACETGAQLAMTDYLLKDALDSISPLITQRIEYELERRILTPYLNSHFWWMGNGDEPLCNWTIWCTQNILLTGFLQPASASTRARLFQKACDSIDYFLAEYGEDGCCDEGAQYYHHAGLCLFNAMEVLNGITNGSFESLYDLPKIKNIAAYISHVHVGGPYYINFADCSPKAGYTGSREYLFGKRTHNLELMSLAASHYQLQTDPLLKDEINLFYRVQSLFTDHELMAYSPTQDALKEEIYYPSVGLFIARDDQYTLAVKAGDNADSHNHNDTGSFTLYKNALPLFVDIGVESYTQKTFSSKRYEIWTMQSDYHNLPTLNGYMEKDGAAYHASQVQTTFTEAQSTIEMELSTAYEDQGHLQSYRRKVTLIKGKEIVLTDCLIPLKASNQIILNLITYEQPFLQQKGPSNLIFKIGQLGTLEIEGSCLEPKIEVLPITDDRLKLCWDHDLFRIRLPLVSSKICLHIH